MPCRSVGGGYPSMPCKSVLGGSPIFLGGCLQFFGGSPIFQGGLRGTPQFFWGGDFFFISPFFGDTPPQDQTPEYGQRSAGTHPTGMLSCVSSTFDLSDRH